MQVLISLSKSTISSLSGGSLEATRFGATPAGTGSRPDMEDLVNHEKKMTEKADVKLKKKLKEALIKDDDKDKKKDSGAGDDFGTGDDDFASDDSGSDDFAEDDSGEDDFEDDTGEDDF